MNPLTGAWVCDIGVSAGPAHSIEARFKAAVEAAVNLAPAAALPLPPALDETLRAIRLKATLHPASRLKRYSFCWAESCVLLRTAHGYVKRKRARSIKKRMAKRLTRLTQRRYWFL